MKYETAIPIARGAMGEVSKAWDPIGQRFVALKFLRHRDPESVARQAREARAQARVEHPNVCRVYEVGEMGGRPFIAMQWIDGVPLDEVAEGVSLETVLTLVRTVAGAVQAAHDSGLIHRDLKPGNILVERADDGALTPYVLDFGIARQETEAGFTVTGQVLGTPGYLAPEQASGALEALGPTTDVFGLGAVLYRLTTGVAPFAAPSATEALVQVLDADPRPPRQHAPTLPRDVETVILRCLEKNPRRRYRSARALAEDLDRILADEPITARRVGFGSRLLRRARRRPRAAAWMAGLAMAALVSAGLAIHARSTAARQTLMAQTFVREAEQIEAELRHLRMSPLHDLGPKMRSMLDRVEALEIEVRRLGPAARGLGSFALGRAALALDRPEQALAHLERAWDRGYREPEARLALGVARGRLYRLRSDETRNIDDPVLAGRALVRVKREHLDPALRHLQAARDAGAARAPYLEALIAMLLGEIDRAAAKARQAVEEVPWLFEAKLLEGDAELIRTRAARLRGDLGSLDGALERADVAFEQAATIAPSESRARLGRCEVAGLVTATRQQAGRDDWEAWVERGLEACLAAAGVDSLSPRPFQLEAELHRQVGQGLMDRGDDPIPAFRRARNAAERALELAPDESVSHRALGIVLTAEGAYLVRTGQSPATLYARAREHFAAALDRDPGAVETLHAFGEMSLAFGRHRQSRPDADPTGAFADAIDAFEGILSRIDYGPAATGLGFAYRYLSDERPWGSDEARDLMGKGVEACQRGIAINPSDSRAWLCLATLQAKNLELADREQADAGPHLEALVAAFEKAVALRPNYADAYYLLGRALVAHAEHMRHRGADVRPLLDRSIEAFGRAIESNPEHTYSYPRLARAYEAVALEQRRAGLDPTPTYRRQIALALRALELNPRSRDGLMQAGEAHFQIAIHRSSTRDELPSADVAAARDYFQRLHEVDPATGALKLGWIHLLRAGDMVNKGVGDPSADLEAARRYQIASVADDPDELHGWLLRPRIELHAARWALARNRPVAPYLRAGEDAIRRAEALGLGGQLATSLRLRGRLECVAARGEIARSADPRPVFDRADAFHRRASEADAADKSVWLAAALCKKHRIEWMLDEGADVAAEIDIARGFLERVFDLDPDFRLGRDMAREIDRLERSRATDRR